MTERDLFWIDLKSQANFLTGPEIVYKLGNIFLEKSCLDQLEISFHFEINKMNKQNRNTQTIIPYLKCNSNSPIAYEEVGYEEVLTYVWWRSMFSGNVLLAPGLTFLHLCLL